MPIVCNSSIPSVNLNPMVTSLLLPSNGNYYHKVECIFYFKTKIESK